MSAITYQQFWKRFIYKRNIVSTDYETVAKVYDLKNNPKRPSDYTETVIGFHLIRKDLINGVDIVNKQLNTFSEGFKDRQVILCDINSFREDTNSEFSQQFNLDLLLSTYQSVKDDHSLVLINYGYLEDTLINSMVSNFTVSLGFDDLKSFLVQLIVQLSFCHIKGITYAGLDYTKLALSINYESSSNTPYVVKFNERNFLLVSIISFETFSTDPNDLLNKEANDGRNPLFTSDKAIYSNAASLITSDKISLIELMILLYLNNKEFLTTSNLNSIPSYTGSKIPFSELVTNSFYSFHKLLEMLARKRFSSEYTEYYHRNEEFESLIHTFIMISLMTKLGIVSKTPRFIERLDRLNHLKISEGYDFTIEDVINDLYSYLSESMGVDLIQLMVSFIEIDTTNKLALSQFFIMNDIVIPSLVDITNFRNQLITEPGEKPKREEQRPSGPVRNKIALKVINLDNFYPNQNLRLHVFNDTTLIKKNNKDICSHNRLDDIKLKILNKEKLCNVCDKLLHI